MLRAISPDLYICTVTDDLMPDAPELIACDQLTVINSSDQLHLNHGKSYRHNSQKFSIQRLQRYCLVAASICCLLDFGVRRFLKS